MSVDTLAPVAASQSLVGDHGDFTTEPGFGAAYVDVDEWRDAPRRHRYVHGGFHDTHTRFSFYFLPAELYRGRFFQFLEGGAGGHETLLQASFLPGVDHFWLYDVAFDELGGYMVESNQGHFAGEGLGTRNDGSDQASVNLFDASAQSALFSKHLAAKIYGAAPHHGYVWGVSGGGLRSVYALENRPDVWDGGAPHAGVHNTTQWCAWGLAWLHARKKFPQIMEAMEPGGSGDPFAGLSHLQREALADLYRRGYPRGAENQLGSFEPWAFTIYGVMDEDPTYFTDFWNAPGYLGHDNPEILSKVLFQEKTTVKKVFPASQVDSLFALMHTRLATAGAATVDPSWGVSLNIDLGDDPERMLFSKVKILSGKAAGRELLICDLDGEVISPFSERNPDVFEGVEPGDELEIDNRDFVAFCHYHRYAVEGMLPSKKRIVPQLAPWTVDGIAVYPQRAVHGRQGQNSGKFKGKMIYVQPTKDNMVWNTTISGYHELVKEHLGDRIDEQFRLWFVENSPHGAPEGVGPMISEEKDPKVWTTRLVSYDGASAQSLRELVRWVEEDVPPTPSYPYEMSRDNALILPATAAQRGGVQPLVSAEANGGVRAEVAVGEAVTLKGLAENPGGKGAILSAEWDFTGKGLWEHKAPEADGASPQVAVTATHAYDKPGVYFPSFRVGARLEGGHNAPGPLVENLARVRVVVRAR